MFHVNTSLGLVGGCITCIPPVTASVCSYYYHRSDCRMQAFNSSLCCHKFKKKTSLQQRLIVKHGFWKYNRNKLSIATDAA